jgi:hypothetical protein
MLRNKRQIWLLTALIASLAIGGLALAAKPGGGGGGGTVPAGTIYFVQPNGGWLMNSDGSGKVETAAGEPSFQIHAGSRWFLESRPTERIDANGTPHVELFAVDEEGFSVQLTDDPIVEPYDRPRWAKNDSFLSFTGNPPQETLGLYVAEVDWTFGVPLVGTPELLMQVDDPSHDWSPAGDEVVFSRYDEVGDILLDVTRFLADGTTETRTLGYGFGPVWSPDGQRIAFVSGDRAIWTMLPDGTDAMKVSKPNVKSFQTHGGPNWSPDSQYLVFTESTPKFPKDGPTKITSDILRISAGGGGTTNLTKDTDINSFPTGWR